MSSSYHMRIGRRVFQVDESRAWSEEGGRWVDGAHTDIAETDTADPPAPDNNWADKDD